MLTPRNAKGNPIPEPAEGRIFKGWIRILIPNQHSQGTVENVFKPYKGRKKNKKQESIRIESTKLSHTVVQEDASYA